MKKCNPVCWIPVVIVLIAGINYGLIGFFHYNLLEVIFGVDVAGRVVYAIIGVAAVAALFGLCKCAKSCKCCKGTEDSTHQCK